MAADRLMADEPTADEARMLCSFVPALMLSTVQADQAAIEPPTTRDYEAVALFAVRMHSARARLLDVEPSARPQNSQLTALPTRRTSPVSLPSTSTLHSTAVTASGR